MASIRFVVTGDLEKNALRESVARCFPPTNREGDRVEWKRPRRVNGATTHRLVPDAEPGAAMTALARALVAEVWEGSSPNEGPPTLVVAVDDLELANLDQPEVVVAHVRKAVEHEIARRQLNQKVETRLRDRIRERCSFHLFCPMVETFFFGDREALVHAGTVRDVETYLVHPDVEQFETSDPDWLPLCKSKNALKVQQGHDWWRHERHPKHYLEFLVDRNGGLYDEVIGGKAAFNQLKWPEVPSAEEALPFARAFFEDLADYFGVTNPLGHGAPSSITYPQKTTRTRDLLLRNL